MPSSRFLEKRDQDPRHCSTIITPNFSRRTGAWRNRGKWVPRTKLPGTALPQGLRRNQGMNPHKHTTSTAATRVAFFLLMTAAGYAQRLIRDRRVQAN